MNESPFTRSTVISVRNGRVVLKEENGKYITIVREPDPNITVTVEEEPNPPLPSASNPSEENLAESQLPQQSSPS